MKLNLPILFFLFAGSLFFYAKAKKLNFPFFYTTQSWFNDNAFIRKQIPSYKPLSTPSQQEALLKIFYVAGYFNPLLVEQDLRSLGLEKHIERVKQSLEKAGACQNNIESFNPSLLRQTLFEGFDDDDRMDYLLYVGQHAYNRSSGKERFQSSGESWMDNKSYQETYYQAAETLGLIQSYYPQASDCYDAAWILGASRFGLLARLKYFKEYTAYHQLKFEKVYVLTGARELTIELDGLTYDAKKLNSSNDFVTIDANTTDASINERQGLLIAERNEAAVYIKSLADSKSISYDQKQPFQKKSYGTVLNVNNPEEKITEAMMANDLIRVCFPEEEWRNKITVIDTKAPPEMHRPDTKATAYDATEYLFSDFNKNKKTIMVFSNYPYLYRQLLSVWRGFSAYCNDRPEITSGKTVIFSAAGFANQENIKSMHSELAALLSEYWLAAHHGKIEYKRPIESLLYQKRSNVKKAS